LLVSSLIPVCSLSRSKWDDNKSINHVAAEIAVEMAVEMALGTMALGTMARQQILPQNHPYPLSRVINLKKLKHLEVQVSRSCNPQNLSVAILTTIAIVK
jgi:hypothetical protein